MASVVCDDCGEALRPRPDVLMAEYVRDFESRLVRKPRRMLSVARQHPLSFVFSYLPRGLISNPGAAREEGEMRARGQLAGVHRAAQPARIGPAS